MLFIIALVIAILFSFLCGKALKKHPYIFYILALAISVVTVLISTNTIDTRTLPIFVNTYIISLFTKGALATALWAVVMWTGALPNGSFGIKKLMPIRGELSIFTAILTLAHNIGYGKTYFVRFFTDLGRLQTNYIIACILTFILLLIMIPLTVISFPQIRKKMSAKIWKKIQRFAYIFYALIYVHIMFLYIPFARTGRSGCLLSVIAYSVVFIGYAVFRIRKFYIVKCKKIKKEYKLLRLNTISALIFIIPLSLMIFVSYSKQNILAVSAGDTNTTNTNINAHTNSNAMAENTFSENSNDIISNDLTSVNNFDNNTIDSSTVSDIYSDNSSYISSDVSKVDTTTSFIDDINSTVDSHIYDVNMSNNESLLQSSIVSQNNIVSEGVVSSKPEETSSNISEIIYVYKNGTYTASAFGYDGDVEVSVTIKDDKIVSITGISYESDTWYFEQAQSGVIPQIINSQNCNVDAVSGATYSSNAIISAVQQALNSAKN